MTVILKICLSIILFCCLSRVNNYDNFDTLSALGGGGGGGGGIYLVNCALMHDLLCFVQPDQTWHTHLALIFLHNSK